jgi:hypothetical protein
MNTAIAATIRIIRLAMRLELAIPIPGVERSRSKEFEEFGTTRCRLIGTCRCVGTSAVGTFVASPSHARDLDDRAMAHVVQFPWRLMEMKSISGEQQ